MVQLLQNKINVASSSSQSMQARVFFGREPNLGIKVVLKQYKDDLRGIFREIRIFTELERIRKNKKAYNIGQLIEDGNKYSTLPQMLSYSTNTDNSIGEILMTNEGPTLDFWHEQIIGQEMRMKFAVSMISQIVLGLKQLHDFGYSHGDLKFQNICARPRHNKKFKFTLIDLGVSMKLP